MTVRELVAELQTMPQDSIVIMQKDGEGNGYSPLYCVDPAAVYRADSEWSGDVYSTEWNAHGAGMGEDDWEEFKRMTPACVVLAPTN